MRSRTSRGVSKWSRRKDSYIGRLYSDIGKVPSDSGIFRSTRGVTGIRGNIWALVGFRGKREEDTRAGCAPHGPSPNWTRGRGGAPSFLLLFLLPSPSLPFGGLLLGLGVQVGPHTWGHPRKHKLIF